MEEHKILYKKACELYSLIQENIRVCPPACDETLKEASYFLNRACSQLILLLPVEEKK